MENYIVINGKKAELTPEQLETLGIEVPKAKAFERVKEYGIYYSIDARGNIFPTKENSDYTDEGRYYAANYCTDKVLMRQRALHEILNRQLWRFSMLHNGDKINWDDYSTKYYIFYDRKHNENKYCVDYNNKYQIASTIYFYSEEIAQQAIDEIIKPFIAEHPDFKW